MNRDHCFQVSTANRRSQDLDGPSLKTLHTIHILLPFSSVWFSFVFFFVPSGVVSLLEAVSTLSRAVH